MDLRPASTPVIVLALAAGLAVAPARAAGAQVTVALRAGATWSSPLVEDVVVAPITVRPAIAPTLGVSVGAPLRDGYSAAISVDWARSDVRRTERGESTAVVALTRWTAMVSGGRALTPAVAVRAGLGLLRYVPSGDGRDATLFRNDAPTLPLVGFGVSLDRPMAGRHVAGLDLAYDVHQFSTAALRTAGFTGRRTVHRLTLRITIGTSYGQTEH